MDQIDVVATARQHPEVRDQDTLRALLGAFSHMEWEYLRKDIAYLVEKGYLIRQAGAAGDLTEIDSPRRSRYESPEEEISSGVRI